MINYVRHVTTKELVPLYAGSTWKPQQPEMWTSWFPISPDIRMIGEPVLWWKLRKMASECDALAAGLLWALKQHPADSHAYGAALQRALKHTVNVR